MSILLVPSVITLVTILGYYIFRILFFLRGNSSFFDIIFAILLIVGETYIVLHATGFIVNIIKISGKKTPYKMKRLEGRKTYPKVAVIVAVKNEPMDLLENTLISLKTMNYPNFSVFLLDGSTDEASVIQNKHLVKKYALHYFYTGNPHGAKAGIINDFIKNAEQKYLAVFDADQNPLPDFLEKVVSIAESDPYIAFVQTPQFYSNISASPIARAAALQQAIFYESICEGKNVSNAMFCCGTNVLFRMTALKSVGGFDEESITEDFATSVKLHANGYKSIYYNHTRVFGKAPENLTAYFTQQDRWSAGTVGVLKELIKIFFKYPRSLSIGQWWEYLLSSTYYFIGIAFFLLMICPITFLIFNIPSYFASPTVYLMTFLPYFVTTLFIFLAIMKKRKYRIMDVYNGIIIASASFPVLIKSVVLSLIGKKTIFRVTQKSAIKKMTFLELWPWNCMIALNVIAIGYGIQKFFLNPYAVFVNIFWCGYHIFILSKIYSFNNQREETAPSHYEQKRTVKKN